MQKEETKNTVVDLDSMSALKKRFAHIEDLNEYQIEYNGASIPIDVLWDLPLESVDRLYGVLYTQLNQGQEDTRLETEATADSELSNILDIIKYVVETRHLQVFMASARL